MMKTLLRGLLALALLSSPVLGQQVWKWSQTPATNASSDPAINWATGMAPSAVSPSARAMMAAVAKFRDDTGGLLTTAGSSTAYTLSSNSSVSATPANGYVIGFTPHVTNGVSATLQVDGGTAFPIQIAAGSAVPAAALVLGSPYLAVFSTGSNAWILHGYYGSPSAVPIGAVLDYAGTTAPNSNFALAYGQAVSRTTYAGLFAQVGTTFGSGDGTTTFNLPDTQGRAIFGKSNMSGSDSGRITVAGGNFDGTVLGGAGGLQNHTLLTTELPIHTPSGSVSTPSGSISGVTVSGAVSITDPGHIHTVDHDSSGTSTFFENNVLQGTIGPTFGRFINYLGGSPAAFRAGTATTGITASFSTSSGTGTFNGNGASFSGTPIGSGSAHTILPPAIILSKIIRIF